MFIETSTIPSATTSRRSARSRLRSSDRRAGVRDREDDQQTQDAAHQHPPRLVQGPPVAGCATTLDEQQAECEHGRHERGKAERLEDADPFAEARHDRDLDRPGQSGGYCECGREPPGRHGSTITRRCRRAYGTPKRIRPPALLPGGRISLPEVERVPLRVLAG